MIAVSMIAQVRAQLGHVEELQESAT